MDELRDGAQALDTTVEDVPSTQDVQDTLDTAGDEAQQQDGSGEVVGAEKQEKLYAGKYKTVEELEKAYTNMVRKGTQLAMQLAEIRKNQNNQQQPQNVQQVQPQQAGIPGQAINNDVLQQLAPVVVPLMQQVRALQEQQQHIAMQAEVSRLRSTYEDFDEVAPILPKLFEATPQLFNLPNPIETAYFIAKSQFATEQLQNVYNEATKQAYNSKAAKQKAVTEGQQSRANESTSPEEEIAQSIVKMARKDGSIFS
jgi:hypothetical protein